MADTRTQGAGSTAGTCRQRLAAGGGSAPAGVRGAGLATAAGGGVCLSHGTASVASALALSTTSQVSQATAVVPTVVVPVPGNVAATCQ